MRKLFLALLITLLSFSCFITDANAKRFGGGRSFGMTRSANSYSRPNNVASAQPASPAGNKWLGPLAGLAMGGLLASLFMGHGLGTGMLSWLMVAGVAFILWRLFQNMVRPAMQGARFQNNPVQNFTGNSFASSAANQTKSDFDEMGFLRQAKSTFIRLQAAYDEKNLVDIREFTSPEMFAEIQMQLQERGDEPNVTDVVSVDAQLLDVSEESNATIASVMFDAQIREQQDLPAIRVKEIWHFRKDGFKTNWAVAGIAQD
jgi:predicted lipid-binding transport protein (Tim44 family)